MKRGILRSAIELTTVIPVSIRLSGRDALAIVQDGPTASYLDMAGIAGLPVDLADDGGRLAREVLATTTAQEMARRAVLVAAEAVAADNPTTHSPGPAPGDSIG